MRIPAIIAVVATLSLGIASEAAAQDQSTPAPDPSAPQNPPIKSPNDMTQAPLAKGHNSFTKKEAQARIESAGYTNVGGLFQDKNGLWQATATRNGQTVRVALDYKGNVAAN